jgi:hypothetical protein
MIPSNAFAKFCKHMRAKRYLKVHTYMCIADLDFKSAHFKIGSDHHGKLIRAL